ncbi:MAG: DUF2834 domain-containing protein [Pseudomonadota bacterium]|nr:DUF2834 domain-containing protein [Pseudomonadota bacterium]
MVISRKALCIGYALIGALAFVGSWGNILDSLAQQGFIQGTLQFWTEVLVNGPSRFITVDILFLTLAIAVWMVLEARRLKMPGIWLYLIFGALVAISLAVPLFLIHRERRLAALEPESPAGQLHGYDLAGIGILATAVLAFTVLTLTS